VLLSSHYLIGYSEAVAAPLVRRRLSPVRELEVLVSFRNESLVLAVLDLSSIEHRKLGGAIGTLREHEDDIRRALERLFTGF
jgi:toxin CcdB